MNLNNKIVDIYLNNIDENGKRKLTWVVLAKKHNVSKVMLSRVSSIRKYSTDDEFDIFLECMRSEDTVMLSNGTSSHNIDHIALILREGNKIVGKGKVATTTNIRSDRSSVYLLKSAGYYKVGVTLDSSIQRRIAQLQIGNPFTIELVAKTGTIHNAYGIEKSLHSKFKDNRVRGEWFSLSDEELEVVLNTLQEAK